MTEPTQNPAGLTFHHVGLLVDSISDALVHYEALFGKEQVSGIISVTSQRVNVCFVQVAAQQYLELVEPTSADSAVSGLLKKRIGYYHMAYLTDSLQATVDRLERLNYKALEYFVSEAFPGKKCIFLITPEGHLVEMIGESEK